MKREETMHRFQGGAREQERVSVLYDVDLADYGGGTPFEMRVGSEVPGVQVQAADVMVSGEYVLGDSGFDQQLKFARSYADAKGRLGWERYSYADVNGILMPCAARVMAYGRDGAPDVDQVFKRMFDPVSARPQTEFLQVNGQERRRRVYVYHQDGRDVVTELTRGVRGKTILQKTFERVGESVWRVSMVKYPGHEKLEDVSAAKPKDIGFTVPAMQGFRQIRLPDQGRSAQLPEGMPTPEFSWPQESRAYTFVEAGE